jgi:cell fate (sporulation/competence/biofilm development) regulator YlbF (YheA/YmcA/DUF963 family)
MTALTTLIDTKLNELCAAIASDADLCAARDSAESFLADQDAVALYREVITLGRDFERRQHQGEEIDESDVSRFETLQSQADQHPGIRSFADSQEKLQSVLQAVNGFVAKTLESGSVPTHDEVFGGGSCGTGCGCH